MDERLETLLANLKAAANQAGDLAADAAYAVSQGASTVVDCARTKLKLADLKAEVNTQLRELGELLYATHTGTPTDSDVLLEKMQKIDALKAQIAEMTHTQSGICPVCGAEVDLYKDTFCKHCGTKL